MSVIGRFTRALPAIVLFFAFAHIDAAVLKWDNGGSDDDWHTAANWSPNRVPGKDDDVVFDATSSGRCVFRATDTVKSIRMYEGYAGEFAVSKAKVYIMGSADFGGARYSHHNGNGEFYFLGETGHDTIVPPPECEISSITKLGASTTHVAGNRLQVRGGGLTINAGIWDFGGGGRNHRLDRLITNNEPTINFDACTLSVRGRFHCRKARSIPGSGVIVFPSSGSLEWGDGVLPRVISYGDLTIDYGSRNLVRMQSLDLINGSLDLKGVDLTITDWDLEIRPGKMDSTGLFGLGGNTITVAGDAYFAACFEDTLNMASNDPWTLDVSGSIMARSARIGNCTLTGSPGTADFTCIDAGGNSGWDFVDPPPAGPPYRFLKYLDKTDKSVSVNVRYLRFFSKGDSIPSPALAHPTVPRPYIASPSAEYGDKDGYTGLALVDDELTYDGGDSVLLDIGPGNTVYPDSIAFHTRYVSGPEAFMVLGSPNGSDWDTLLDTSNIDKETVYSGFGGGLAIPVPKASTIVVSKYPSGGGTTTRNELFAAVTFPEDISASPAESYRFVEWRVIHGNISIGQPNSQATTITLNTISEPLEIQAVFECMPTIITQHPTAPLGPVAVGGTFSLEFAATVCPDRQEDVSIQWERKGSSGLWETVEGANATLYPVGSATKADSGSYRALIDDGVEVDTTHEALVSVLAPPSIPENQPNDISTGSGIAVVFRVTASGDGDLSYQWFEDGIPVGGNTDSLRVGPVDESYDGREYHVIVTNEIGSATSDIAVLEIGEYVNPFQIVVENTDPHDTTHVKLTINAPNLDQYAITGSLIKPSYIDSAIILYSAEGQPVSRTSPGANAVGFSAGEIRAAGNTLVIENLEIVPKPAEAGDNYYFGIATKWCLNENCSADTLTMVKAATPVFMKDTITPANVLTVTGDYGIRDTNATLTLSNLNAIDQYTDSIVITAGYNNDLSNPFFSTALDASVLRIGPSQTQLVIHHREFPGVLDTVYVTWRLRGRNGLYSQRRDTLFTVGVSRPVYGGVFSVEPGALSDRLVATWDMPQPTVDSVKLWWTANQNGTIPLGAVTVPGAAWKVLAPSSVSDTITGLTGKVLYHVGFQVKQDGLWSVITETTRDTATTSGFDESSTIENVISINSAVFDGDSNKININFSIDYAALSVNTEVQWAFTHSKDSAGLFELQPTGWDKSHVEGDTSVYLSLGESIPFNSTYYVGMWLQGKGPVDWGKPAAPTESSFVAVEIGSPTWEVVNYLFDKDTVRALGGKLLLVRSGADVFETDTIRVVEGDAPEGLVPVSDRIQFVDHKPTAKFKVALRIDSPGDPRRIRLYRETGTKVLVEHGSHAQAGYAWLKTNELDYPFRAYIDTAPPVISLNEKIVDTSAVLTSESPSKTSFKITDNIDNAIWRVSYSTGKADLVEMKTDTVNGRNDSVTIPIDRKYASSSYGLRVIIEGIDGGQTVRVNASRDILVDNVEVYPVPPLAWTPVRTPFKLNEPSTAAILGKDGSLKYDTEEMRLFRWMPRDGNSVASFDNWAEYNEEASNDFSFVPGRLMWLKVAENRNVVLTNGVTTSLRSPFEITLAPKAWTDFSTPYKFDIYLGDVLDSTAHSVADTIQIVKWNGMEGKYTTKDVYPDVGGGDPRKEEFLTYDPKKDGYSAYNPFEYEVKLRIPPEPVQQSLYNGKGKVLAKKARPKGSWSLSCVSESDEGIRLNPIALGYVPGSGNTPTRHVQRPTMLPYGVCVRDEEGKLWAHEFAHTLRQGGVMYTVVYYNSSSQERSFKSTLQDLERLGSNGTRVFKEKDGQVTEVPSSYTVTVAPNSEEYRWVAVGSGTYLNSAMNRIPAFKLAFAGAYPNPFRSQITLEYTLPITGVKDLSFRIYSASGREVWNHRANRTTRAGRNRVVWNGRDLNGNRVAAGVYFVRMKAVAEGSDKPQVFTSRLTFMP